MTEPQNVWSGMQPRYVAYCRAHAALTPDEMLARDQVRWPGGCMAGYISWVSARWAEWRKLTGADPHFTSEQDHADFDAWLSARRAPEPIPAERALCAA